MNGLIAYSVIILTLGCALFALWHSVKGYQVSNPLFWAVAAVEAALLGAGVFAIVLAARGGGEGDPILFWSYFATTLIVPPIAVVWGVGDKSRWGTGVIAIAMITVAVLVLRVHQIWEGHA